MVSERMSEGFWKAWEEKKKELRKNKSKCTCGKDKSRRSYHYYGCAYLIYWDTEYWKFAREYTQRKTLKEYV